MRRSLIASILRPLVAAARPLPYPGAAAAGEPAVPNIPLTTHDGVRVKLYDDLVKDKVVLINFMFTTCSTVCPRATANLARVAEGLGDRQPGAHHCNDRFRPKRTSD